MFERKIPMGVSHCTGDFEFKRKNPYRDDVEFERKDPYRDFSPVQETLILNDKIPIGINPVLEK